MKNILISVMSLFLLMGCNKEGKKDTINPMAAVTSKANQYKILLQQVQDTDGFIETSHCDSTLFSALTFEGVQLEAAEEGPGRWIRRPTTYPECYAAGESKSTISRDMFIGIFWYAWRKQDLPMLNRIWDYGFSNFWKMGDGDASRVMFTPIMISTLAQMIYRLGGENHNIARNIGTAWVSELEGFQAHLQVLLIGLRGVIYMDGISQRAVKMLKYNHDREPNNHLFQAMYHKFSDGNQAEAINLLLGYPVSLPTSADWCSPWPTERDYNTDSTLSCNENRIHSGGELLFSYYLIK